MADGCVDAFPCDCNFRECFSRSVHDPGQWKTCNMCVCENLSNFTAGDETCVATREGKPMLQCQLSIRSDRSTGCRLILTQQYVIIFSFVGIFLTLIMILCLYNVGGWYFYKTRLAQEEDDEDDSDSDTAESFMQENPTAVFKLPGSGSNAFAARAQYDDDDDGDDDAMPMNMPPQDDTIRPNNRVLGGGKNFRPAPKPPQIITITNDGFDNNFDTLDESDDEVPDVERPDRYSCMHIYIHSLIYIYIYIYIYVYICTHTNILVHIYTRTHILIHIERDVYIEITRNRK